MHPITLLLYLIHRFKRSIVFGVPILTLLMLTISHDDLRINGDIRSWFDDDAQELIEHEAFTKSFGSDSHLIIVIHSRNGIIDATALQSIKRMSQALRELRNVVDVYSLSSAAFIGVDPQESSDIIIDTLIPSDEILTTRLLEKLRQRLRDSDGLLNRLLSDDHRTSLIIGRLSDKAFSNEENALLLARTRSILERERAITGLRYLIHGSPVIKEAFIDIARKDLMRFTPLVFLSALLLLLFTFRSWYAALLPIIVIAFTTTTIMTLYIMFGLSLDNFTATIPVFILAIGIADSVHIYWTWRLYRQNGYSNDHAIDASLHKNTFPASLTTATTFIGFGTLLISDVIPIRTLGVAIAASSVIAFVYSTLYIPAFLAWADPAIGVRFRQRSDEVTSHQALLYERYAQLLMRHYRSVITITAIVTVLMSSGIFLVRFDTDTIRMFPSHMPVRSDLTFIQKHMTGPVTLEIMVDSKHEGGVYDPLFLKDVEQFSQECLAIDPVVRHIYSPIDLLKRMHKVFNDDNQSFYIIPERREIIEEYITMYNYAMPRGSSLRDLIDANERFIRLSIRMDSLGSEQNLHYIRWIKQWFRQHGHPVTVNGKVALSAYLTTETTRTMLYSIALNITLIGALFYLLFRQLSPVIFALLPNIIPLLAVIGMMGWLGIAVDMGIITSIVIILGVAMDATIYFVVKYRKALAKGKSIEQALIYMLHFTGIANILSTLILMASLSLLIFSQFAPNIQFGYITLFALTISLVTDLLLLPALLIFWQQRPTGKS